MFGLVTALFGGEDEKEIDVEELKNMDNLDDLMEMFKDESPSVYEVLVKERDGRGGCGL